MSNIRALYTALASLAMNFANEAGGTTSVAACDLDELKGRYEKPDLPARILLPMEEYGAANSGVPEMMNAGSSGVGAEMGWNVIDLYLHTRSGQGRGPLGSENHYLGVECKLNFRELINPGG